MHDTYTDVAKERQGFYCQSVFLTSPDQAGSLKVRTEIQHDTSYAFQSFAKVEVWDPANLRWNLLDTYHYDLWAHQTGPATLNGKDCTTGIVKAVEELKMRARIILGVS